MFKCSNNEDTIIVNDSDFNINGQIATNGTVNCSRNTNINYTVPDIIEMNTGTAPNTLDSNPRILLIV